MGERTSEEQQQAMLGVIALVAILGVAWLAIDTFLGGESRDARNSAAETSSLPSQSPSPSQPLPTSPPATFHSTVEDGCRALIESGEVARVSAASAREDNAWMARRLGGNYRSVGTGECDQSPVIVVGVASPFVDVPAAGPAGTSTITYWQPPIVPFGE